MKICIFIFLSMFLLPALKAQDTLYTRNGKMINAKVLKVRHQFITIKQRYHPPSQIPTPEVFMITYQSGQSDTFKRQPRTNRKGEVFTDYDQSLKKYRRTMNAGIAVTSIGGLFFAGGAIMVGYGIDMNQPQNFNKYPNANFFSVMALTGFGAVAAAIGVAHFFAGGFTIKKAKGQKRFAQHFKSELSFAPVISPSGNGAGMGMSVNF